MIFWPKTVAGRQKIIAAAAVFHKRNDGSCEIPLAHMTTVVNNKNFPLVNNKANTLCKVGYFTFFSKTKIKQAINNLKLSTVHHQQQLAVVKTYICSNYVSQDITQWNIWS